MAEAVGDSATHKTQPPAPRRPSASGGSPFRVYKAGQGQWVRGLTAAGLGIIILGFGYFLSQQLTVYTSDNVFANLLPPVAVVLVLAYLAFYFIAQHRTFVDFLVATEGEMKKVHWSTRQQVFGATRVVIVTVFALAILLFVVDIIFMAVFESIGVLRLGALARIFGGGGDG